MFILGLCLDDRQNQGHQRQSSKGSQRERAEPYKERKIRWTSKARAWRGDPPGKDVPPHRRDKNQNGSDICKEIKDFFWEKKPPYSLRSMTEVALEDSCVPSGGTPATPSQWNGILR